MVSLVLRTFGEGVEPVWHESTRVRPGCASTVTLTRRPRVPG